MTSSDEPTPKSTVEPLDRMDVAWSLLLALCAAIVFSPILTFEFLNFDDPSYVVENRPVSEGISRESVVWSFTQFHEGHYHPITWLSHALDVELFGMDAAKHHRTSLAIYAGVVALCFLALRSLGLSRMAVTLATLLFALHPLRIESVAWISTRKDLLSGFFFFAALFAYGRYAANGRVWRMASVVLLFALGLLCKPTVLVFPALCLLLDAWPLKRISYARESFDARIFARLCAEKIPLVLLSLASIATTFLSQRAAGAVQQGDAYSLSARVANAGVSYLAYVGRFLWPLPISVFHPYERVRPGLGLAAWLVVIGLSVAVARSKRMPEGVRTGWFWFVVAFVPTIGFVQVGGQSMADRWLFVPGIGLVLCVVVFADTLISRGLERAVFASSTVAVLALTLATRHELPVFHDNISLFTRALDVAPNFLCHNNLGTAYEARGDQTRARDHYAEAVRLNPTYPPALTNYANALARENNYAEATKLYERALAVSPDHALGHYNAALAFALQGRVPEALSHYRDAVRLAPDYAQAHLGLGATLLRSGDLVNAERELLRATELAPRDADGFAYLGRTLVRAGKRDAAREALRRAIEINPNHTVARSELSAL